MKRTTVAAFVVLALVFLGGSWADAQDRAVRRGGDRSGGGPSASSPGRGGRGGGSGYSGPATGAQLRHPRAGTGGYGYYGGHGYGGHGYGHGSYYRGYPYRGHYGHGYRGSYGYPYGYYGYSPYYYGSAVYSPYLWAGWSSPYLSVGLGYQPRVYGYADSGYAEPGYAEDGGGYAAGSDDGRDPGAARPDPDGGLLVLEVRPAEAAVYVDDEFRGAGRSRLDLRLSRGPHRLEVVHPRYRVFTRELAIEPGDRVTVVVDLDRH